MLIDVTVVKTVKVVVEADAMALKPRHEQADDICAGSEHCAEATCLRLMIGFVVVLVVLVDKTVMLVLTIASMVVEKKFVDVTCDVAVTSVEAKISDVSTTISLSVLATVLVETAMNVAVDVIMIAEPCTRAIQDCVELCI